MIFLTMGTGMGGGVIAEGRLLRGCTDMGGEIGHLRLAEDGPVGFGKAGSFEGFASGGGIQRQARVLTEERIREGRAPAWVRDGHAPKKRMHGCWRNMPGPETRMRRPSSTISERCWARDWLF